MTVQDLLADVRTTSQARMAARARLQAATNEAFAAKAALDAAQKAFQAAKDALVAFVDPPEAQ